MSTNVTDLLTRSLMEIDDRDAKRTTRPDMLVYFNRVQEKLAAQLRCLETDYYFDLFKDEPRYKYPEDNVQMTGMRISSVPAPTQLGDYFWVREFFSDEFRGATSGMRPSGSVYAYHARASWVELLDAPTADVVDGGIITVWRIPQWITVEGSGVVMELPDWMRGVVQEGMMILARITGRERAAALDDWQRWENDIDGLREKFEDRSDDRRPALRPPGGEDWTNRMR